MTIMSPDQPSWGRVRIAIWALAAVAVSVWLGPKLVRHFRPPEDRFMDFSQEWLSAKNYWAGTPVYANQTEALFRHTGQTPKRAGDMLPWNAHPPAATALTLPFGKLSYPDALQLWNLLTFPLFLVSVGLVLRELGTHLRLWSVFPAIVLLLLFDPLYQQLAQGQLNFLLLFLITLAWVADRHGRIGWAGVALGLAAGLKLYPAFLFAYFLFGGRRRALLTGGIAFFAVNGLALALLGIAEFQTYIREVVPSLSNYRSSWENLSVTGFWLRIFDPQPHEHVIPLVAKPLVAKVLVFASQVVITMVVAWRAWSAKSVAARDGAFATAVAGMVLVSPIAWTHYFVLLVMPIGLVWQRLRDRPIRWVMVTAFVILWLPGHYIVALTLGYEQAFARLQGRVPEPLTPGANLAVISLATYALVALFVLVLLVPAGGDEDGDEPVRDGDGTGESDEERLDRRLFGPPGG